MERRGRPPSFTSEDLIVAARRLGPDALSLPALASELGIARTSLYWHVKDHNEVGEMVLTAIIGEGEAHGWEAEPEASWDEVMASYADAVRTSLLAAGGWIRYTTPRLVFGREQLRAMDGLVGRLVACGFDIKEATRAYAFLFQVVIASVGSGDAPVVEMHQALIDELQAAVEEGELKTLRQAVAVAAKTPSDAQFEYDLDCTLRGIAARSGIRLGTPPESTGRPRRRRRRPDGS